MAKLAVSVTEAAEMIGVSRAKVYNLVHSDGFPVCKLGGRTLVPVKDLEQWIADHTTTGRHEDD